MSNKESHEAKVKVLNEEYERVLNNPDNIIVSEDLQELLDLTISEDKTPQDIDTMILSVLDSDGLPTSTRGEFSFLGRDNDEYSIVMNMSKAKKEFLKCLDKLLSTPGMLTIQGEYTLEVEDCEVCSWSITQNNDSSFSLSVRFRSENGIF